MKSLTPLAALLAALSFASATQAAQNTLTFSIDADWDFATTINGLHSGQAASADEYTVAILFNITQFNGISQPANVVGFCSEIAQPISPGTTYTANLVPLSELASFTAGQAGSASSGIPTGGIGELAAARISYLYDHHYEGTSLSDWSRTTSTPDTIAFQIVQWELTHDSDLSLSSGGSLWINASANTSTLNANSLALAQTWLDEIGAANVSTSYTSQNWDLLGVSSPTFQDVILATNKGFYPVPEPSSMLLALLGIAFPVLRRRRR